MCSSNDTRCLPPRFFQESSSALSLVDQSFSSQFTPTPSSSTTTFFTQSTTPFTTASSTSSSSLFTTTSTPFSSVLPSSTSSLDATTSPPPPPSSSSDPPPPPTPTPTTSLSLSSGFTLSTFTSSFVTEINGSPTTIVTPIVTALRATANSPSSSRTAIIAGSSVAGAFLLILALSTLFCLRRRRRSRQRYWALSRSKRLSSRPTFGEEELDLPFPSPPFVSSEHDPFSTTDSSHGSVRSDGGGGGGGAPVYIRRSFSRSQSPSPNSPPQQVPLFASTTLTPPAPPLRLLRTRASESGSIFQEGVWPPPSAASQLMDPLTYPSQSVDLARVVTDVMGPPEPGPLLLLQPDSSSRELGQGQGQEQEQGALKFEGESERRALSSSASSLPPSSPPRPPPRSARDSGSESDLSLRPPSTPWLSRPLNPSPRGSPLQRTLPL